MRVHRGVMAAGCLVAAAALAVGFALESAEVIVLHTRDAAGTRRATRVWVADDQGTPWIEAANADRAWYHDLLANPDVEVERQGETQHFRAVPVPGAVGHATVRRLLAERYGLRDTVVGWLADTSGSIGIRLEAPGRTSATIEATP